MLSIGLLLKIKMADNDDPDENHKGSTNTRTSLQHILKVIKEERTKETYINDEDYLVIPEHTAHIWSNLFEQHFLLSDTSDGFRDDMLFYVRKCDSDQVVASKTEIEVYRKLSKKQPVFEDQSINWEETVYLNIILHQFVYTLTCAVCMRTANQHLQILRKYSQRVYASPSQRCMDGKGTEEQICYPNIFFTVDNFEEAFSDIVVHDSEFVTIELVASDRERHLQRTIFQGSIQYEHLKKVYDAKARMTTKMVQRMTMGWINDVHKRVEFVHVKGPSGKGMAEIAVSRLRGAGAETPDMETMPADDFGFQQQPNNFKQRRTSDSSETLKSFINQTMKKSHSEAENVDDISNDQQEPETGNMNDELEVSEHSSFWRKSFGQARHWFKARRQASGVSLNAYFTFVALPWHSIIADVLEVGTRPVLMF